MSTVIRRLFWNSRHAIKFGEHEIFQQPANKTFPFAQQSLLNQVNYTRKRENIQKHEEVNDQVFKNKVESRKLVDRFNEIKHIEYMTDTYGIPLEDSRPIYVLHSWAQPSKPKSEKEEITDSYGFVI